LQLSPLGKVVIRKILKFLAVLVKNRERTLAVDVLIDAVEVSLNLVGCEFAIRYFVIGL
jgi:hypothetical protein